MEEGMSRMSVRVPPYKPALELYEVYETFPKLYIIACDINRTSYNVLKLDRMAEDELSISEDKTEYSAVQMRMLLDTLRAAFRVDDKKGGSGFRHLASGFGIFGMIRFTRGYNLVIITKRKKVAQLGPHAVYELADTEFIPICNAKQARQSKEEAKYKELFLSFETKKDFYFSYTYDLSHTLQYNCQRTAKQKRQLSELASFDDMFVFNSYLLQSFQTELRDCNSKWVLPCIHGYLSQMTFEFHGRKIRLLLIARRSRYFAGTRYLKRGISEEGNVANHLETEQIVYDTSTLGLCGTLGHFTSFVQVRGSIPIYWYQPTQDQRVHRPRPPIKLGRSDPGFMATKLHLAHLFSSYGTPIVALDLLKQKEKNPRESILGREYQHAIESINKELPEESHVEYIPWDFRHASRMQDKVNNDLTSIAEEVIMKTGIFNTTDGVTEQKGILRTNCVDCLDRTNLAQFFVGKCALGKQLILLGVASKNNLIVDQPKVTDAYLEHYIQMGDRIALQYGGSRAVSAGVLKRGVSWDLFTSLTRYYSNNFVDLEKQKSMNLFLGNYTPNIAVPKARDDDADSLRSPDDDGLVPMTHKIYAFQRPFKFILDSYADELAMEGSPSGLSVDGSPAGVLQKKGSINFNGGVSYSFPEHYRSQERRFDNGSFNFGHNPPPVETSDDEELSMSGKRVIDLWDIENDYYLHLQDNTKKGMFVAPPVSLSARWWELPLLIFTNRLLTSPVHLSSHSPCHGTIDLGATVASVSSFGSGSPRSILCDSLRDTKTTVTLPNINSWRQPTMSPDNLLFESIKRYHRCASNLTDVVSLNPIQKGGDADLQLVHPVVSMFFNNADEELTALNELFDPVDPILVELKKKLEGKFSLSMPYSWPTTHFSSNDSQAFKALTSRSMVDRTGDVPSEDCRLYEEYVRARQYFERGSMWDMKGAPWKAFMADCKGTSYYKQRSEQALHQTWMVSWLVKELVANSRTYIGKNRKKEVVEEENARHQYASKSLTKYEQYASLLEGETGENMEAQYEAYIKRPEQLQEELSSIEAEALQSGEYFPEQDTGPVVCAIGEKFEPFLEAKIHESKVESCLYSIVAVLREGFVLEPRIRHVRTPTAMHMSAKRKGASEVAQTRPQVFEKSFLARQAIDFVLGNLTALKMNALKLTFCANPRETAAGFLDLLQQGGVIHHVIQDAPMKFEDNFHIFRFMEDEELRVLNVFKKPQQTVNVHPVELSQLLLRKALSVYKTFIEVSDHEIVHLYIKSPKFMEFSDLSCDLQYVNLSLLTTDQQKIAFWVNIYNVLEIHAQFTIGGSFHLHESVYLCTSCYLVGGFVVSLDIIQNGILRGNRRAPVGPVVEGKVAHRLFRPFKADDPRKTLAVKESDSRVHFVLLRLTSDDLPNFVAEEDQAKPFQNPKETVITSTHQGPYRLAQSGITHSDSMASLPSGHSSPANSNPRAPSPKDHQRSFLSRSKQKHGQFSDPQAHTQEEQDESSSDEEPVLEQKSKPVSFLEVILGASKKTVQKPPINIVLDADTVYSQLKDIAAKSLQWGLQITVEQEPRTLYLPDVFFRFWEDFGVTRSEKVRHLFLLLSGSVKRKLVRFTQQDFTLKVGKSSGE
eukprot:TRINITY_DN1719_c0_g1_i1.p1 TRINITY_DN1719_c0_g1~~TRINITY_DN1719_c0_g1_i1.p1  ORF type:complete len:1608 (+),score=451.93 TRINITY_DN1719_c0_g1_i1:34-4857(+)